MSALLDLLVYRLGLDEDALLLANGLDAHVLAHPEVLAPLALAAARTGETELSERWVGKLEGERAAEVHCTLAGAALARGDLAGARGSLHLARRAFASAPELLALEKRLGEAQALAAEPHEATLQERVARDDWQGAEALAHQILDIHPGSASARRVLRDVAMRARQVERENALDELRATIGRGDTRRARQILDGLRALDVDEATLAPMNRALRRIEDARTHEIEQCEVEEVVRVLSQVASPRALEAALERYSALAPHLRAEVRKIHNRIELQWLDEIAAHEEESRLVKLIPVIVAMGAAEGLLAAGTPDAARATLERHVPLLRHFRRGRDIVARLATREAEIRRQQAEDLLARAEQAFGAGDEAQACGLMEKIRRNDLPEARAQDLELLKERVGAVQEHRSLLAVLELALTHDHIGARIFLQALLVTPLDEPNKQVRQQQLSELEARLREDWIVLDQQPVGLHAGNAPEMARASKIPVEAKIGLLPGRDPADLWAIFASAQEGLLFVRIVGVASQEIRRLLVLRLPKLAHVVDCGLADRCVWIVDENGRYLEISCDDWLPRLDRRFRPPVPNGEYMEAGLAIPQDHALWLATCDRENRERCRVRIIDIWSGRVLKTTEQECDFHRLLGAAPPLVSRLNYQGTVRLAGAGGAPVRDFHYPREDMMLGIARAPSGKGYVILIRSQARPERIVVVLGVDAGGIAESRSALSADTSVAVACMLPKQLGCICYHDGSTGEARIAYLRQDGGELRLFPDVPTHGTCELLSDEAATTCVAVRRTRGGVVLTRLDDVPTQFPEVAVARTTIPRATWPLWCPLTSDLALEERLRQQFVLDRTLVSDQEEHDKWVSERVARYATSYTSGLCFYRLLRAEKLDEAADTLLRSLLKYFPTNPYVRLAEVERDGSMGRWTGDALLEQTSDASVRSHLLHVRAMVCLHCHRFAEAVQILAGAPNGTDCRLGEILALARALLAGRSAEPHPDGTVPGGLAELVTTILWADHHLEHGDLERARHLLDQAWIREVGEVQSLARLAHIYLAAAPDPATLFRTAAVLADFADADRFETCATDLWLGRNTWGGARVNEVLVRARAWLDGIRERP